ncbi:MAG: NAD(P)-dependent oxidoreductase [Hyphomicrobiales bacterium]
MKLFVFGLGFSATAAVNRLGPSCFNQGGWVAATCRGEEKAESIRASGLRAHIFSGEEAGNEQMRADLKEATHILMSISPGADDPVLAHHGADIASSKAVQWIGYYSTVGVYGDHQGAWVDEAAELRPVSKRSNERVKAEGQWIALAAELGVPIALVRLAGIYGPGRNTFMNFKKGIARRIIKPGQVFNRIHVSDIGAMTEAMALQKAEGVFNGADNEPAPPQDVVEFAANMMGVDVPPDVPFDEADLSPMGRSFYGETKRVSNARLAQDLGIDLEFPNYRKALTALWNEKTWDQQTTLKAMG